MTTRRNGAASAPARPIAWHRLPYEQDEETGRWPSYMLPCEDGDELLARTESGEVVPITVDRRHGVWFRGPDGEHVDAVAIAERPRRQFPESARDGVQLKVRITAEQKRRLEWIKAEDGYDFATIVGLHIDQEWEERHGSK